MSRLHDDWRNLLFGHELELLARIGIDWPEHQRGHIRCPFPDHEDGHPSWRWDRQRRAWFCTCGRGDGPPMVHLGSRMVRYRVGDLLDWIKQNRVTSTSDQPEYPVPRRPSAQEPADDERQFRNASVKRRKGERG